METTQNENRQTGGGAGGIILFVIWLAMAVAAGVLSWMANSGELMGMHIIYTIFAFFSGPAYLVYYLIIRVILGYEYNLLAKIPK